MAIANLASLMVLLEGSLSTLSWTTVFIGVFTFYIYKWIKKRRKQLGYFKRLGIPYVPPHLCHGSLLDLKKDGGRTGIKLIGDWLEKYGNVFGYFIGWRPYLLTTDLELVKQVLVKDFSNFVNRPKLPIKAEPVVDTVVGLRDQRWKEVREVLSPTFSMLKMKLMVDIVNKKIDTLLTIVKEETRRGKPVEWYSAYQGLTLDTISECALAMKSQCQVKQNADPLFSAVRSFLKNAVNPAIVLAICFPSFSSILSFVSNKLSLSGKATQMIVSHLKSVIKNRRHNMNSRNIDFLQLMLNVSEIHKKPNIPAENEAKEEETKAYINRQPTFDDNKSIGKHFEQYEEKTEKIQQVRSKNVTMTDQEIIANAWVFVLGGFETTSAALTCVTYLLAQHPQVQEKLYQEVVSLFQTTNTSKYLDYETVINLTYLDQVLKESLRLYPPVISFISREAKEDIMLGKYLLPRDTCVQIPIWNIHRDPKLWPNPDLFDPERFSSEAKSDLNRHPMSYIPFGAGPRNCIGKRFALMEAKLALARIILEYRLEPCSETPKVLDFTVPTVSINPAGKILLKAIPRNSPDAN